MEKIRVVIDWCDRNYGASVEDDRIGGAVVATHKSHEGVLKAIAEALRFHVESAIADGDELPSWLVSGDYELCFEYSQQLQDRVCDMKMRLSDILMTVSWREFANHYFGRSSSWLYHKMDGIDGNGRQGGFTKEEAQQMHGALCDLADRIRRAADNIPIGNDTAHC